MTNSNTRARDYSHEHALRQKRQRRLHADINKDKAEEFKKYLNTRGLTFARWLDKKINEELKGPN